MALVYALKDPRDGEIRYIGKTSCPETRFKFHRNGRGSAHCGHWEKELIKQGLRCEISILEDGLTDEQASDREIWWIAEGHRLGWNLTNLTDGGDGTAGMPDEIKRKIGANTTKCLTGKKQTAEHAKRAADARRGLRRTNETKEKIRVAQLGKCHTPETRAKMRASHLGKPLKPETIAKLSEIRKGKRHSPEHATNLAISLRKPETRQKLSESIKRSWEERKLRRAQGA